MKLEGNFSFPQIIKSLQNNPILPLQRGGTYEFIAKSSTKINGESFNQAIHYRISDSNSKRVTFELIRAVYDFYLLNKAFPTKAAMMPLFPLELCSRPCNYSVAIAIVTRLIQ
jgi:hypothetical protein